MVIGVDPHKLSAAVEVLDDRERALGGGRLGIDRDGYRQGWRPRRWPERVWATPSVPRVSARPRRVSNLCCHSPRGTR
jgi:hypothetical protein